MENPLYAFSIFEKHYSCVDFPRKGKGFVSLELGPGDSLFSALISSSFGGSASYLVDVGSFASEEFERYNLMAEFLRSKNLPVHKLNDCIDREGYLSACNARYLVDGINSLRKIPDSSVDFIWSNAVLEHIRKKDFLPLLQELRRILRPDGICSHRIDLRDHLSCALNNLRFSEKVWESDFFSSSGFYTNRIRFSQMLELFGAAKFSSEVINVEFWNSLPTPLYSLALDFKRLPEEELLKSGFDVILRPI
jgi:SAM-dependent methyltransferase